MIDFQRLRNDLLALGCLALAVFLALSLGTYDPADPPGSLVFPAHDYKGDTVSTIGEEKAYNPRLQVKSVDEYIDLMGKLNLPNPKMMDVAVPANMKIGMANLAYNFKRLIWHEGRSAPA